MYGPNHIPPQGCYAAPRYVGYRTTRAIVYPELQKQRVKRRVKRMYNLVLLVAALVLTSVLFTDELARATLLMSDHIVSTLNGGEPLSSVQDAKFVEAE